MSDVKTILPILSIGFFNMRFRLPTVLKLCCTNQCSRIEPMFSPQLVPSLSSSCIHKAASGLQFIQLCITTKLPPRCVLIIVISRRPLDLLSPLFRDSGSNVVLIFGLFDVAKLFPFCPRLVSDIPAGLSIL